jgi:short-subunit dehydrogenase
MAADNIGVLLVCPGPVVSDIAKHTIRNPENPVQEEGVKMPTERCTGLMAKAMYHGLSEVWVGDQPLLTVMYIAKYAPGFTRQVRAWPDMLSCYHLV